MGTSAFSSECMDSIRCPLFRLKSTHEIDPTRNPLFQTIDRSVVCNDRQQRVSVHLRSDAHLQKTRLPSTIKNVLRPTSNPARFILNGPDNLGNFIEDWQEHGFELNTSTCELTYYTNESNQKKKSLGFVQSDTSVLAGPAVETTDFNEATGQRLSLFTIVIRFMCSEHIFPKFCVLGHPDAEMIGSWISSLQSIIQRKRQTFEGWDKYLSHNNVTDLQKAEEWALRRKGPAETHVNAAVRRCARLRNGKVLQDIPAVFESYSEQPPSHEAAGKPPARVMSAEDVVPALAALGLDLPDRLAAQLLDELARDPPCRDRPGKLELAHLRAVFEACRREMLVPPSAEMRALLLRTMRGSGNPFLSLLAPAELAHLVEGRDAAGRNVCICRRYPPAPCSCGRTTPATPCSSSSRGASPSSSPSAPAPPPRTRRSRCCPPAPSWAR